MENSVECVSDLDLQDCVSSNGSRADIALPEFMDNGDLGVRIAPEEMSAESECAL